MLLSLISVVPLSEKLVVIIALITTSLKVGVSLEGWNLEAQQIGEHSVRQGQVKAL